MSQDTKSYPTSRPPFFAQRYIRLLTKTCAAMEIGTNAAFLCTIVAAQEDAKRYSGAVNYFNSQLLPLLGLRKWEALDRARKAAVDGGWLHYEAPPSGLKKPGIYWATIPPGLESLTDGACDEAYPANGDASTDRTPEAYTPNGYGTREAYPANGDDRGDGGGEHPNLALSPKEESASVSDSEEKKPAKGKKPKASDSAKPREYPQGFPDWWKAYPRHVKKPEAAKAFTNAIARLLADDDRPEIATESEAVEFLTRRAESYARQNVADGTEPRFIAHPASWLNGDRFDDEYGTDAPQPNAVATKSDLEAEGWNTEFFDD